MNASPKVSGPKTLVKERSKLGGLNSGRHNADLLGSAARIMQGSSWRKARIILIMPAGLMIPTKVALSHWSMIFPPNQAVFRMLALGKEVGEAYSDGIEEVLKHPELSQWEFLLTVEHDNIPPADGVLKLIKRMWEHPELHCIGGLYWTKGEGGVPQIWGDPKDPVLNFRPMPPVPPQADKPGGLVECCGTGMGFNLWRLSMFKDKNLKRPLFKTQASADGVGTQDLAFWSEARKWGYRCAVDCDVLVGHYDVDTDTVW